MREFLEAFPNVQVVVCPPEVCAPNEAEANPKRRCYRRGASQKTDLAAKRPEAVQELSELLKKVSERNNDAKVPWPASQRDTPTR